MSEWTKIFLFTCSKTYIGKIIIFLLLLLDLGSVMEKSLDPKELKFFLPVLRIRDSFPDTGSDFFHPVSEFFHPGSGSATPF